MSDTTFTYDDDTYSDLYKEAYGFRPRGTRWATMTPAEKQVEWNRLCDAAESSMMDERSEEWRAMERFEALVASTIETGAGDRETAIRWLLEASEAAPEAGYAADMDYFCYLNGLPYGYFGGTRNMMTGY